MPDSEDAYQAYIADRAEQEAERQAAAAAAAPQRASRASLRARRTPSGRQLIRCVDGPLEGRTYEVAPGSKSVDITAMLNQRVYDLAIAAGAEPPEPMMVRIRYRKAPGYTDDGCAKFKGVRR